MIGQIKKFGNGGEFGYTRAHLIKKQVVISLDLVCHQSDQIVIIEGNKNDGNRSEFGVARVLTIFQVMNYHLFQVSFKIEY